MILKHLKQHMILPKEEYILNQWANIRGIDVLLLSFTIDEDRNCLWIMYINDELAKDNFAPGEYKGRFKTKRQELLDDIEYSGRNKHIHIKEIEIQGQIIELNSSTCSSLYDDNIQGKMQLQHFAERGLLPLKWDDIYIRSIFIAKYEQDPGQVPPIIDMQKDLSIVLHIDRDSMEIPIQSTFILDFGKYDIGTKISYYDKELGKENCFFIDGIYSYDVYDEIMKSTERINDEKLRKDILNQIMESMENICPKGMNMAVIKYETTDNAEFRFMTKEYFESEPVYSNNHTGIAIGFGTTNNEIGINGYKLRECILQPIDKDFSGKLELELFSRIIILPEETIRCSGAAIEH